MNISKIKRSKIWNLRNKKSNKRNLKLIQILLLFFLGTNILFLLLSGLISYNIYKNSMTKKIASSRVDVLAQISERVSAIQSNASWFSNYFYYGENISENYFGEQFSESETDYFNTHFSNLETLSQKLTLPADILFNYVFMFENGYTYASNGSHNLYDYVESVSEDWYPIVLENKSNEVWLSTHEDEKANFIVTIARSVLDQNGKPIGIFLFNLNEINFYKTYASRIENNEMYIIDANGHIVSHNDLDLLGLHYKDTDDLKFLKVSDKFSIIKNDDGEYLMTNYQDKSKNWIYVEKIPLSIVMSDINQLRTTIFKIGLILFVTSSLFAIIITYKTTTPLKKLVKKLKEVGVKDNREIKFEISGWEEIRSISSECNAMNFRIIQLVDDIKETEEKKRIAEMGYLQAQMNPHFIYNTLFSIKCLAEMDKKQETVTAIDSFISILKYILMYQDEMVEIAKEVKMLEDYSTLQKTRYGNCFDLTIDCDEKLYSYKILRMVLQPLVENSILHSIPKDKDMTHIKVVFRDIGDGIMVEVIDDGIGFTDENLERLYKRIHSEGKSNMVGINNIRDQIRMRYGKNYGITIDSKYVGGARVVLKLPKR